MVLGEGAVVEDEEELAPLLQRLDGVRGCRPGSTRGRLPRRRRRSCGRPDRWRSCGRCRSACTAHSACLCQWSSRTPLGLPGLRRMFTAANFGGAGQLALRHFAATSRPATAACGRSGRRSTYSASCRYRCWGAPGDRAFSRSSGRLCGPAIVPPRSPRIGCGIVLVELFVVLTMTETPSCRCDAVWARWPGGDAVGGGCVIALVVRPVWNHLLPTRTFASS